MIINRFFKIEKYLFKIVIKKKLIMISFLIKAIIKSRNTIENQIKIQREIVINKELIFSRLSKI